MKKSSFVALLMGTVGGVLFALGMCMALLPEWNAFLEGVIFGGVGLVLGVITLLVWCKMENKKLPKMNGKNLFRIIYTRAAHESCSAYMHSQIDGPIGGNISVTAFFASIISCYLLDPQCIETTS